MVREELLLRPRQHIRSPNCSNANHHGVLAMSSFPPYDPIPDLQTVSSYLAVMARGLGYTCNLSLSRTGPPDLRYSCWLPSPADPSISLYGWGATPAAAYEEAARRRQEALEKFQQLQHDDRAAAIRERHRAAAEAEIAALSNELTTSSKGAEQ